VAVSELIPGASAPGEKLLEIRDDRTPRISLISPSRTSSLNHISTAASGYPMTLSLFLLSPCSVCSPPMSQYRASLSIHSRKLKLILFFLSDPKALQLLKKVPVHWKMINRSLFASDGRRDRGRRMYQSFDWVAFHVEGIISIFCSN
jgi:hypothetical protein